MAYWSGLEVKMLGTFDLAFEGVPVHLSMKQSAKPVQLFQLLLNAGDAGVSRRRIIDALFSHEAETDATNSLNVAVSRLRKLLRESLVPDEGYISVRFDYYYLDVPFPVSVDTDEVEALRQAADLAQEKDRISILYKLCDLYQGRFLPDLDGENWVEVLRAHYQRIFRESLGELCTNSLNRGAWSELTRLIDFGSSLFPYEGWEEWYTPSLSVLHTDKNLQGTLIDANELCSRAAAGPVFLTDKNGVELVVLTREEFEKLS